MTSVPVVQYASRTDVGMRRAANQDSLAVRMCTDFDEWSRCGHLFAVADGMGGHAVGDLASRITVSTLPLAYYKQEATDVETRLRLAIIAANKAINDKSRENREFEGMGTTCSVLSLSEAGAMIGHVGDSRVYRVRRGRIEQLTFDHSLQWEMIRLGRATAENVELYHPRNVITRCLGPDLAVQIDVEGPFSVEPEDVFMLCSDGLTNHVNDEEIGVVLSGLPPEKSSRLLIDLANCRGGSDNSTVIVVHIESYPALTVRPPDSSPLPPPAAAAPAGGLPVALMLLTAVISLGLAGWTMFRGRPELSAIFAIAAIAAFLLSRYFRPEPVTPPRLPTAPLTPLPDDPRLDPSMSSALRSSFRTSPPYRTVDCQNPQELLKFLAEAQSELAQAARDSSWRVDFDELTQLGRQATTAIQSEKPEKAIRARARAIELLMKEIYQRRGASTNG